jgi:hypothetical protein
MRDTTQEDPREVCLDGPQWKDDCYYMNVLDSLLHETFDLEHMPSYSLQVVLGVPTWCVCCLAFQDEQGAGYLIFRCCFHFYFWLLTSGMYYPGGSC